MQAQVRIYSCLLIGSGLLLSPERARADDPSSVFGSKGRLAMSNLFGINGGLLFSTGVPVPPLETAGIQSGLFAYSVDDTSYNGVPYHAVALSFTPSVDVFVTDRLTVGGSLAIGYDRLESVPSGSPGDTMTLRDHSESVGLSPRVGYVVPLGGWLALWPRLEVGFGTSRTVPDAADGAIWTNTYRVQGDIGLVVPIGRHLYVDIGPTFGYSLTTTDSSGSFGVAHGEVRLAYGGSRAMLGLVL
jgi:hypothetical protein